MSLSRSRATAPKRTSVQDGSRNRPVSPNEVQIQPASPEVISNLLESLSFIPPADGGSDIPQFPSHLTGMPRSPSRSLRQSPIRRPRGLPSPTSNDPTRYFEQHVHQNTDIGIAIPHEDVAESPNIRTARPPSGLSLLTAKQSQRSSQRVSPAVSHASLSQSPTSTGVSHLGSRDISPLRSEDGNSIRRNGRKSAVDTALTPGQDNEYRDSVDQDERDFQRKPSFDARDTSLNEYKNLRSEAPATTYLQFLDSSEESGALRRIKELKAAKESRLKMTEGSQSQEPLMNRDMPTPPPKNPARLSSEHYPRGILQPNGMLLASTNGNPAIELGAPSVTSMQSGSMRSNSMRSNSMRNSTHIEAASAQYVNFSRNKPPSVSTPSGTIRAMSLDLLRKDNSYQLRPESRQSRRSQSDILANEERTVRRTASVKSSSKRHNSSSRRNSFGLRFSGVGSEQPQMNVDPISQDVNEFLRAPRLSQTIIHPEQGRTIAFSEVGDPRGHAVFCCVGMGMTRYTTAFYDELASSLKLRLITPDRPGIGDSQPYIDGSGTPLAWPDDILAICDRFGIEKFSLIAHSAGAIYALATALRVPQQIRGKVYLLAPWIPPSQMSVIGKKTLAPSGNLPKSQRLLRVLPSPFLRAANSSFMTTTSSSLFGSKPPQRQYRPRRSFDNESIRPSANRPSTSHGAPISSAMRPYSRESFHIEGMTYNPVDDVIPRGSLSTMDPAERQKLYDQRLTPLIWDLATRRGNPAVDLIVCLERNQPIGFRYVDINRHVMIYHGNKDNRVPIENIKWLTKIMRKAELQVIDGEGHGLMANAAVMGGVLTEISKHWA